MSTCFIAVSLQFPYNLPFCKLYIDTLKPPIVGHTVFLHQWLIIWSLWVARPGSWRKGRASSKGYRLCSNTGLLEPDDSSPLHWWGQGVPSKSPDCTWAWNYLVQIHDVPFLVIFSSPQPCLCCPCSHCEREEGTLPGWSRLDWLRSCHQT